MWFSTLPVGLKYSFKKQTVKIGQTQIIGVKGPSMLKHEKGLENRAARCTKMSK